MAAKSETYAYLKDLEAFLNKRLPNPGVMRHNISEIVANAKLDDQKRHLRNPEDAFLNEFAVPLVFEHMQHVQGVSVDDAKESLLLEYYRYMKEFSLNTPARTLRHPLSKTILSAENLIRKWRGELKPQINELTQPCPDFAFVQPFPHSVVFEGKYFDKKTIRAAEKDFSEGFYETFFYLSCPEVEAAVKRPNWNYNFACFFAYDASEEGLLANVWEGFPEHVKSGFWEGASVYLMILRGKLDMP